MIDELLNYGRNNFLLLACLFQSLCHLFLAKLEIGVILISKGMGCVWYYKSAYNYYVSSSNQIVSQFHLKPNKHIEFLQVNRGLCLLGCSCTNWNFFFKVARW